MQQMKKILVVDDEENLRHMLCVLLRKHGYQVETAPDGNTALQAALRREFDFILCDIRMPVMDGPAFLQQACGKGMGATIIMMSAYGTIDTAIDCMKLGAYDYVSKPFKNDEILLVLKKAEERQRLARENRSLKEAVDRKYSFASIVSKNTRMLEIFSLIKKVCDFKTTVLIQGDSGTGKELVARAIHHNGLRKNASFVAMNCGAIPENLLESELFGHLRGAFTDAVADKAGLFAQADGGTLFLDEIGEMPLSLQVKLLRVLQEGEIRPLGSSKVTKIDVRVISATAKDLSKEVESGRFREDLFYRLNVFSIKIPPLRERAEDIPLLVDHFIDKHGERIGKRGVRISPEALKSLLCYQWPGNVRELENCIERCLIICDGSKVTSDCLPDTITGKRASNSFNDIFPDCLSIKKADQIMEKVLIKKALERTGGNRTHAAKLLEISHRALLYKLKAYGLD